MEEQVEEQVVEVPGKGKKGKTGKGKGKEELKGKGGKRKMGKGKDKEEGKGKEDDILDEIIEDEDIGEDWNVGGKRKRGRRIVQWLLIIVCHITEASLIKLLLI